MQIYDNLSKYLKDGRLTIDGARKGFNDFFSNQKEEEINRRGGSQETEKDELC